MACDSCESERFLHDEAQQGEYQVRTNAMQAAFDKYDGYYDSENTSIAEAWNIRWPVAVQASEG